ncbi:uncharacterized protein DUF1416 [Haloactinopolyspora alba]|uniref:Uncharacterized protein DUF1416 n=1 Tax=Haloactinopolyspora alba TaxID=648780 RepID=A0A2P8DK01_9ACTN|nr:DUF1416 domain-containing protein [Haloactinopolyspora alba]PSK97552.1 uncharacterized protein DUF1416 [Haloactinopolyspora alba]
MCGATTGGVSLDGVDVSNQTVIQGVVQRDDAPLAGAYVRLLDATGEFTAEVPTSATGQFRFFAAPGTWTVRTLAPGADTVDRPVVANTGVTEVDVHL